MTQQRTPYHVPGTPTNEQVNALLKIRLVAIEDLIEIAEQRGQERVDLDIVDARWLVEKARAGQ